MITQTKRNAIRQRIHDAHPRQAVGNGATAAAECLPLAEPHLRAGDRRSDGQTLVSASSIKLKTGGNVAAAKEIGKAVAEKAVEKGIKKVVFDRGGYLYHGRIKALADAAREAGLEF